MAGCCNYSHTPRPPRQQHTRGRSRSRCLVGGFAMLLLQVACLAAAFAVSAVAGLGDETTTDPLDCPTDWCAHVVCPADSRLRHELHANDNDEEIVAISGSSSSQSPPPSAMYIENNQHHHHHQKQQPHQQHRHHQPRHIVADDDDTAPPPPPSPLTDIDPLRNETNTDTDTDTAPNTRLARSVRQFKRRITIVPVDHHTLHKRHTDDAPPTANRTACCVRRHCACDTVCAHSCAPNELAVVVQRATELPGDCCDRIRCERTDTPATCYSSALRQHFENGKRWSDNACTACRCVDGVSECHTTLCKPLACKHTLDVPGECCPRCDEGRSEFCEGLAGCEVACRYGYAVDADRGDCKLCKCVRRRASTTMAPTTMTTMTTTTTTSATTTSTEPIIASDVPTVPMRTPTWQTTDDAATSTASGASTVSISNNSAPTAKPLPSRPASEEERTPPPPVRPVPSAGASSPPLAGADPTDPTILSIRSYFEEHHLYIIVSATVFATAALFAGLVWTYCKFSNKNSYNIVPNA